MSLPVPHNEPVREYAPGSAERASLAARLAEMRAADPEILPIIGGKEVRTDRTRTAQEPHAHSSTLATWHSAGADEARLAIDAAIAAQREWAGWTLEQRAAVFLRAADLLAGPWRDTLNAATMLGQSKTAHQAEIDAACELIDFLRFNASFAERLEADQPISSPGVHNRLDYRPLEGFVYAVTPFNFTAIGGQPADRAGADGQHRRVEAGVDGRRLRLVHDAAARSGRPARRRHQLRARRRRGRVARRASGTRRSRACTSPGRPRSSRASGRRLQRTSRTTAPIPASSARPGARTSSSRTTLRTSTRSQRRSCEARSSTRARSARPPRACTSPTRSGRRCATASAMRPRASAWATPPTCACSWAR